ncbi:DUF1127 domain-containing protein [Pararhizobium haloflavum]|uniref:DUF1127 domain-containing protein n=1 Tax=Pararhizobium haloflavum TaxID=2037914 RepID=UPI000C17B6B1
MSHLPKPGPETLSSRNPEGKRSRTSYRRVLIAAIRSWRQKKAIAIIQSLDDRQLDDIGIKRVEIPWAVAELFHSKSERRPGHVNGHDGRCRDTMNDPTSNVVEFRGRCCSDPKP